MVQWFKLLWKRLVARRRYQRLLDFNKARLNTDIQSLGESLFEFRKDMAFTIIQEILQLARNVQIIDGASARTHEDMLLHRGRLQALDDVLDYLNRAATHDPVKEKKDSGAKHSIRAFRRATSNQAGAAV